MINICVYDETMLFHIHLHYYLKEIEKYRRQVLITKWAVLFMALGVVGVIVLQ